MEPAIAIPVNESQRDVAPAAPAADEATLVARARSGDRAALGRLVEACLADAYDVAYRILGDPDVAQDAVQDGMVSAMRAIDRFRGEGSFRAWVLSIVANSARTLIRRSGRRREVAIEATADELSAPPPDYVDDILSRRRSERIEAALASLPEKQRLAVTLRAYQGLSYREIAAIAQCTEGAARVNYHLGVKRLRQILL